MSRVIPLIGVTMLSPALALACALAFEPLVKPSAQELVLIGSIHAISQPRDVLHETASLHVEDIDAVWPRTPRESIDVRVYQLMTSCERKNLSAEDLAARFSVGSRVALVVAVRRLGKSGHDFYEVVIGGNSSIDPAELPSEKFQVRQKLAMLEAAPHGAENANILRGLLHDQTGEIDLGGAIRRYVPDPSAREQLLNECIEYWSQWKSSARCGLSNSTVPLGPTSTELQNNVHVAERDPTGDVTVSIGRRRPLRSGQLARSLVQTGISIPLVLMLVAITFFVGDVVLIVGS